MYLPFIKFFFGFLFFLVPVWLFYISNKNSFKNKPKKRLLYWSLPLTFAIIFLVIRYATPDYMLWGNIQVIVAWISWVYTILVVSFILFAIFFWIDKLICKIFKNIDIKLRYFLAIPTIVIFLALYIQGTYNAKSLEVRHDTIEIENLPKGFENTKIAVFGDTHLGNLYGDDEYINDIVKKINRENVDFVVFTGDLVNTSYLEIYNFIYAFTNIKANYGKYAVMGNHDFCGYFTWFDDMTRQRQAVAVKEAYFELGFRLLDNNYMLIEKDSANKICFVGVDEKNSIRDILECSPKDVQKILLVHNPLSWEKDVVGKTNNIALTIASHTHAGQFAFEIFGKKYSLISMLFPQWDGKYIQGNQTLFVTRGVGYAGIPVRIGLKPEISILTLKNKNN